MAKENRKEPRERGRPLIGKERKTRFQVMLEPRTADKLRKLGRGNLSAGIAAAADLFLSEEPVK